MVFYIFAIKEINAKKQATNQLRVILLINNYLSRFDEFVFESRPDILKLGTIAENKHNFYRS